MRRFGFGILVLTVLIYTIAPFLWIVITSLRITSPQNIYLFSADLQNQTSAENNNITASICDAFASRQYELSQTVEIESKDGREWLLRDIEKQHLYFISLQNENAPQPTLNIYQVQELNTFTLHNYKSVFSLLPFLQYLFNSAVVAFLTTIFCLTLGCIGAYALARMEFWWKPLVLMLALSIAMFPQISTVTPLFVAIRWLGIFNTYLALIIPYATFALPMTLWILTSFFRDIPKELENAAIMDGLSRFAILRKVFLPLALPAITTTGILVFISCWNEFLFALCFTCSDKAQTVPVGITLFEGQYHQPWGEIAAASVVVSLPLVILMLVCQRQILTGLTAGAVKE